MIHYMVLDEHGTHSSIHTELCEAVKTAKSLANEQGISWYVGDSKDGECLELKPDSDEDMNQ